MKRRARLWIDEPPDVQRTDLGFGNLARVPEDQLQMQVGRDGGCALGIEGPDIHAFTDSFEEPRECRRASIHRLYLGGSGVGVCVWL